MRRAISTSTSITRSRISGIALGEAVSQALGNRRGINRAGYFVMPMDETLAVAAIDLGGRPHAVVDLSVKVVRVGDLQTELVQDFFEGFAIGARANVHVKVLYGRSSHHKIEAVFKAFARALRVACAKDKRLARMLPSTKGLAVIALIDYGAGNLTSVKKALATIGADVFVPGRPERSRSRRTASSCLASVTSARRARSTPRGSTRFCSASGRAADPRHLPRACNGCSRGATKRPTAPASACSGDVLSAGSGRRSARASEAGHRGFRTSDGTASTMQRDASIVAGVPSGSQVYFTHSYVAPITSDTVAVTEHGEPFAAVVQRGQSPACSSTPRSPARSGSRFCGTSCSCDDSTTETCDTNAEDTTLKEQAEDRALACCVGASASSVKGFVVLSKRIIACLDVRNGQVVKGVNFEGLRSAGDPAELARRYNAEGIDELVILDITATIEARRALADTIRAVARELFIPLAVGGGIRTEADAARRSMPAPTRSA